MSKLALLRLQKEERELMEDPIPNILVTRHDVLDFHFCFYGLEKPYNKGFYHGILKLHSNYPFEPPSITMVTPSGKFQVNKPICTSFTSYHKESWSITWTIKTLIVGFLSFMLDSEMGIGVMVTSEKEKERLARDSLRFNLQNETFKSLFEDKLIQMGINIVGGNPNHNLSKSASTDQECNGQDYAEMPDLSNRFTTIEPEDKKQLGEPQGKPTRNRKTPAPKTKKVKKQPHQQQKPMATRSGNREAGKNEVRKGRKAKA